MKSMKNLETLDISKLESINGGRNIISDLGWIVGIGLQKYGEFAKDNIRPYNKI